jgi:hypothetical protein
VITLCSESAIFGQSLGKYKIIIIILSTYLLFTKNWSTIAPAVNLAQEQDIGYTIFFSTWLGINVPAVAAVGSNDP